MPGKVIAKQYPAGESHGSISAPNILVSFYLDLTALINLALRLSARAFCREMTAHTAAGIHPIKVICNIKQTIPVRILPRSRKERKGKKMAINVIF